VFDRKKGPRGVFCQRLSEVNRSFRTNPKAGKTQIKNFQLHSRVQKFCKCGHTLVNFLGSYLSSVLLRYLVPSKHGILEVLLSRKYPQLNY
jgi:hypothetical protein